MLSYSAENEEKDINTCEKDLEDFNTWHPGVPGGNTRGCETLSAKS